jgi:hypothetical protein
MKNLQIIALFVLTALLAACSEAESPQALQDIIAATEGKGGPGSSEDELDESTTPATTAITNEQQNSSSLQGPQVPNDQVNTPENTEEENFAFNDSPAESEDTSDEAAASSQTVSASLDSVDRTSTSSQGNDANNEEEVATIEEPVTNETAGLSNESTANAANTIINNNEELSGSDSGASTGSSSSIASNDETVIEATISDEQTNGSSEPPIPLGENESNLVYQDNSEEQEANQGSNPADGSTVDQESNESTETASNNDEGSNENNDSSSEEILEEQEESSGQANTILTAATSSELMNLISESGANNISVTSGLGEASLILENSSSMHVLIPAEDQDEPNRISFNFRAESTGSILSAGNTVSDFPSAAIILEDNGLKITLSDSQGNSVTLDKVIGKQATLADGAWHEVSISYDNNGDKKVRVYVDDHLVSTSETSLDDLSIVEEIKIGKTIGDRIVLANIQTENGTNSAHVDVNKVTSSAFSARVEEDMGADGTHLQETIGFLSAKPGVYIIDGKKVEVGIIKANHEWTSSQFQSQFNTKPVVVANIYTEVGTHNAHIDIKDVTKSGLTVRVEEDMSSDGPHLVEYIGYIAMEPGVYKSGNDTAFIAGEVETNHNWAVANFSANLPTTPVVIASISTENGADNALPDIKGVSTNGFAVRVEEDMSADGPHVIETISYMAIIPATLDSLPGYIEGGNLNTNHGWTNQVLNKSMDRSITGQLDGLVVSATSLEEICGAKSTCPGASPTPADQNNLVANGSFEEPSLNYRKWRVYSEVNGWKTSSGAGLEIQNHAAGNPFRGAQLIELASRNASSIYQEITTVPNGRYQLQLAFSPRPSEQDNRIEILWNGASVATLDGNGKGLRGTQWKTHSFEVVATGTNSKLELADRSGGRASYGGYIDNVSLVYQDQTSAVVASNSCATRRVTLDTSSGRWFEESGNLAGDRLSKAERSKVKGLVKQNFDLIRSIRQEIRANRGDGLAGTRLVEIDRLRIDILQLRAKLQSGKKAKGIWTAWANERLDLKISDNCQDGWFKIRIAARNHGTLPEWYQNFQIEAALPDGNKAYINVPASEFGYFNSTSIPVYLPKGDSQIKLYWKNDAYRPGVYDANINIRKVKLIPIAEPKPKRLLARNALQNCSIRGKWYGSAGRSLYTFWAKQELYYCFPELPAGNYKVSVLAKNITTNLDFSLPENYSAFELKSGVSGKTSSVSISVPADDNAYHRGTSSGYIEHSGGDLKLYLYWLNDSYSKKKKADANIQIRNVRLVQAN